MGKLQINGDLLLAGNLMMSTSNISAYSVISVKPDSSAYGQNLIIGAGGNTVIGGGESASAFFTASGIKDEENLYLTADGSIHVYTNCNTIANRKLIMSMGADGNITTTGTIITPGNDSVVIKPAKNNYDQIGASDCKFWKIHATTFYGNLSGNADTATTASAVAWGNVTGKPSSFTPSSHTHDYQPIESTTFSITNTSYVSVRTPNRTAAMYYEFWDSVGWAGIRAGDIYDNNNRVLSAGNYTSYTVTKTGAGASGTWGINISGQAGSVYGPYSGNGGNQIPSYIGTNTTKFAMMRNFGSSDIGGYMDCILMNNYGWADVPYATGLGITKTNGYPRAIIANGPKDKWAYATELLTSYNYSWWALPLSGGTMTGKLQVNNIIFGYNYTNSNNAAAFMWDKNGSNYTGVGSCNTTDMIHFGPCNASGAWVSNYNQIWRFQGGVYATGWLETDNYGTGDPGTSTPGYGRGGAIYFKVVG